MGGPKALLCWNPDEPLAVTHVKLLASVVDGPIVVVTRAAIAETLLSVAPEMSVVVSDKPDPWGPAGSIAAAMQTPELLDSVWTLLVLVDQVPFSTETLLALSRGRGDDVDAIRPVHNGRGGHPVLVRTKLLHQFFHADTEQTLRDVFRDPDTRRADVDVDDPTVLQDLDTPILFEQLTGRTPHFWFSGIPGR